MTSWLSYWHLWYPEGPLGVLFTYSVPCLSFRCWNEEKNVTTHLHKGWGPMHPSLHLFKLLLSRGKRTPQSLSVYIYLFICVINLLYVCWFIFVYFDYSCVYVWMTVALYIANLPGPSAASLPSRSEWDAASSLYKWFVSGHRCSMLSVLLVECGYGSHGVLKSVMTSMLRLFWG